MPKNVTTPTRVSADIAAAAAQVAAVAHRTVTEQINYWTRIGMQLERSSSVGSRKLLAVIAGEAQFSSLDAVERNLAHATIDARIAERVAEQRFGPMARKAGQTTVSMDDDGTVVEIAPDGTRRPL